MEKEVQNMSVSATLFRPMQGETALYARWF